MNLPKPTILARWPAPVRVRQNVCFWRRGRPGQVLLLEYWSRQNTNSEGLMGKGENSPTASTEQPQVDRDQTLPAPLPVPLDNQALWVLPLAV